MKRVEISVTKVFGRGRTVIPREVRERLNIRDGDKILWYLNDRDEICIARIPSRDEIDVEILRY